MKAIVVLNLDTGERKLEAKNLEYGEALKSIETGRKRRIAHHAAFGKWPAEVGFLYDMAEL